MEAKKKVIIPVLGIHTAGKSTVANYLKKCGYRVYFEIAQELLNRGERVGTETTERIYELITQRELERDWDILKSNDEIVIIETWHIGNLAHARVRGLKEAKRIETLIKRHILEIMKKVEVVPIFLEIPIGKIFERTKYYKEKEKNKRKNVLKFYKSLEKCYKDILKEFCLKYYSVDATKSPKIVKEQVIHLVKNIEKGINQ